jgi:hypothetical protein
MTVSPLRNAFEWGMTREGRIQVLLTGLSFLAGLAALLYGALYLDYPDWDVGISLVMAFTTLATARWSIGILWKRQWRLMLLAVFFAWLSVDGVYWGYWSLVRPEVMIREGQWMASLCLYLLCGVIWYRLVPLVSNAVNSEKGSELKTGD